MKQKGLATIWIILMVVVILALVGTAIYGISKNLAQRALVKKELEEEIKEGASELSEQFEEPTEGETVSQKDQEQISSLISQFESFQEDQQAERVLSLFIGPETTLEKADYQKFLVMPDDPSSGLRLYSANELSYRVKDYQVNQISRKDQDRFQAKVTETRNSNWSQTAGDWAIKNKDYQLIFVVKKEDGQWKVDQYQALGKTGKYSAFYISNF